MMICRKKKVLMKTDPKKEEMMASVRRKEDWGEDGFGEKKKN